MKISIPEQLKDFIEEQVAATGLDNASEYISRLIFREQERIAQQAAVEALLLEGLDSGEPIEATDAWWEAQKSRLLEQHPLQDQ